MSAMKKLFFILFLALLPACEIVDFISDIDEVYKTVEEQYCEGKYIGKIENYDFPGSEEIPEFETIEDAQYYMQDNFEYEKDIEQFGQADYWQTPEEFYYNRKGDCEDYVIFLGYLLYFEMQYKDISLVIIEKQSSTHAILYCDNKYLSGQHCVNYKPEEIKIAYKIPYSEALWMAENYHDNVGKYR